jgi:hypothetical protein
VRALNPGGTAEEIASEVRQPSPPRRVSGHRLLAETALRLKRQRAASATALVPYSLPIGQVIEDVLLLNQCSNASDWTAGVICLPLPYVRSRRARINPHGHGQESLSRTQHIEAHVPRSRILLVETAVLLRGGYVNNVAFPYCQLTSKKRSTGRCNQIKHWFLCSGNAQRVTKQLSTLRIKVQSA